MSKDFEEQIRNCESVQDKADKLIEMFNYNNYPIPAVQMCNFFGFKIFQDELNNDKHGYILINERLKDKFGTEKIIVVNTKDMLDRRRFTVAHELGHYFINYNPYENKTYYNAFELSNNSNDENEKNADKFAACLLMPEKLFTDKYNELFATKTLNYFEIIEQLSHLFVVPSISVEKRARDELQLINK